MLSRLLSRCSSMSLIRLCLWSTLAFLWCSTTANALVLQAKFYQKLLRRSYENPSVGELLLSRSLSPMIEEVRSICLTSMTLRSITSTRTIDKRPLTYRKTSLSSSKADSNFDDNDFISDEIQSALDMALGEVYHNILKLWTCLIEVTVQHNMARLTPVVQSKCWLSAL